MPPNTYRIKLLQLYKNCKVFYHSATAAIAKAKAKEFLLSLSNSVRPTVPLSARPKSLPMAKSGVPLNFSRTELGQCMEKNLVTTEKDERNICV